MSTALQCTDRSLSGSSMVVMSNGGSGDNFVDPPHIPDWAYRVHDCTVLEVPHKISTAGDYQLLAVGTGTIFGTVSDVHGRKIKMNFNASMVPGLGGNLISVPVWLKNGVDTIFDSVQPWLEFGTLQYRYRSLARCCTLLLFHGPRCQWQYHRLGPAGRIGRTGGPQDRTQQRQHFGHPPEGREQRRRVQRGTAEIRRSFHRQKWQTISPSIGILRYLGGLSSLRTTWDRSTIPWSVVSPARTRLSTSTQNVWGIR